MSTKYTYSVVFAVENTESNREILESIDVPTNDPLVENDGRQFFALAEKRVGATVEDGVSEKDAIRKAVRNGIYFFKQEVPEVAEALIFGLSPELVRIQSV
jgi:hypothetical protein